MKGAERAQGGTKRTVHRKKPMRGGASDGGGGVVGAALAFIKAAGGLSQAKQVLADLEEFREL